MAVVGLLLRQLPALAIPAAVATYIVVLRLQGEPGADLIDLGRSLFRRKTEPLQTGEGAP
jgi:hypothetical protein